MSELIQEVTVYTVGNPNPYHMTGETLFDDNFVVVNDLDGASISFPYSNIEAMITVPVQSSEAPF